jgi:Pvc16 N-terminal domain
MSYAAIYQVTRALRMLLRSQLVLRSTSAVVTLLPPGDALPEVSGVNLYLYRVTESPSTKNRPWPGDRATPPSNQRALGLHLFYLLTPLGTKPDNASFEQGDDAHTMLGIAMLTLQENPVLNDVHLPGFDADVVLPGFLLNSYEQIKIYLVPTSVEELSKIWATINQPYRLSVAYEISLVELTPTPPPPIGGGIVTSTGVSVITLDAPRLTALSPTSGALVHIAGNTITPNDLQITGFGFSFPGQSPIVQLGGQPVVIKSVPAPTDQALTVVLPTDLDAGPQADVRITLNRRTSTALQFTVSPWLNSLTPIRTALDSSAAQGPFDLNLVLKGNGFTTAPQAVRFDSPAASATVTTFAAGGSDTQASVVIPTNLPNGVYNVRIVLNDAATSASNSRTLEVIPLVNSPIGLALVGSVHQLTLNGARLAGTDVRLVIDGVNYQVGPNTNSTQLVYTLGRLLSLGSHSIAVNVDGHLSRSIDLEV